MRKNLPIRTAARAVIIRDDKLLVLRRSGIQGEFFVLPGGGQEHGESIRETLVREVFEEVSLRVEPEELLFINEFIGSKHSAFPEQERDVHQLDFTFLCKVEGNEEAKIGQTPDVHQTGIAWIPLSEIMSYDLHPKEDLNFIMGAPTRDVLKAWLSNRERYQPPILI
ncbi:NUDIX domain-containing protein [Paenibacillus spongiae]|uniref:NUDIX domain-containing protein n=1 Tax=Paenibacillus spongiae TaxID=2909671 RepID=A0ABY5SFH5_9BACL|nr:NUDIX domain-containing protein [Paenibacillus spongiae]UVI32737.1 NUDIX domain-containing protein [Paenibacillus spongiae]